MAWPNCDKCGAGFHAPYEDGLVECVANLMGQRDEARDERDKERAEVERLRTRLGEAEGEWLRGRKPCPSCGWYSGRGAAKKERAAIVAWLRSHAKQTTFAEAETLRHYADAIERGEHLR